MRPKFLDTESRTDLFYLWAALAALAIGGLFALHIAFTSVANAEERTCITPAHVSASVSAQYAGQKTERLTGSNARALVAKFAEEIIKRGGVPGPVSMTSDEAFVLFHPALHVTRTAFFKNGCLVGYGNMPIAHMREMLTSILGQEA